MNNKINLTLEKVVIDNSEIGVRLQTIKSNKMNELHIVVYVDEGTVKTLKKKGM